MQERKEERASLIADVRKKLIAQYNEKHGEVTDAAMLLIEKAAYLEALHEEAQGRLESKGLQEKYAVSTYRSGERENKSLGQMLKIEAAQAKLLRELKLLPGNRATASEEVDDGDDDIDNY